MKKTNVYALAPNATSPSAEITQLIIELWNNIETVEKKSNIPFLLYQDGRNESYYTDCHISAAVVAELFDYEASLDQDEQDDIKANRDFSPFHKLFLKMQDDAIKGRQFNDIIIEYLPKGARAEKPLKIYGGQHRAKSIEAASVNGINRCHGFRIYFGLTVTQRNDIAQVSNANINVPIDLLDRMQETVLGPQLRNWCKKVGLLTKDFAERKNNDGIITARLARTFVVNFVVAKQYLGEKERKAFSSLIANEANEAYLKWDQETRLSVLKDASLFEAGQKFAKLHKKQQESVRKDKELSKTAEFRVKALTPSIISAWAFAAGLLLKDKTRISKLYKLPDLCGAKNPLAVKEMSEYKHQSDLKTYRGLGTRSDKKERGKLIELFLLYSEKQQPVINHNLIDAAVTNYLSYSLEEDRRKKLSKLK
jgi:hypothetical protein